MADDRDLSAESVDIEGIRETLQSRPITFALLFGSTARGESEASSDVDIDALPVPVAYAALRDGVLIAGDENAVEAYRKRVEAEYESTADQRQRNRETFIDRLASGDT